ncbi:helix-turn-helix domain-containing protein [Marivirga harenae]|uniref:helix-turn-helix domain-containing protein n=1 Tax=Marivirga harenae TaxID=2010992 RepID=UPI0026DED912|nr:helix-turn-helix transcriptional regulator [Marivirga harenae]WKV12014.1 helix-turn-helix transcriptional regulator [Marivirga harenae]
MSKYGENIKKIRSVRGLTQSQLADLIDVSRGVISSYEEGRAEPKIETIIKTAEVFNVTTDDLLKRNITVNQLSGFELPNIVDKAKKHEILKKDEYLAKFLPKDVIVIKGLDLNENPYCGIDDLIFGLKEEPIKNKLFVIGLKNESIIGKVTQINEDFIFLNRIKIEYASIQNSIKVIGNYQPIKMIDPFEKRLSKVEKRLLKLEERIKAK